MVLTTSQLRSIWGPACRGTKVSLGEAYRHLDHVFHKWNYRPRSGVTGAYNCRAITGGTGYSLHAYGPGGSFTFWTGVRVTMAIAVDVNWDTNPYSKVLRTDMPRAMVNEILALRTNNGKQVWAWGGNYAGNKDAMHYEIVCSPADISTGIRVPPPPTPTPIPPPTNVKDDKVYAIIRSNDAPEWWFTDMMNKRHLESQLEAASYAMLIRQNGGICLTGPDGGPQVWRQEEIENLVTVDEHDNIVHATMQYYLSLGDSPLHDIIRQVLKDDVQEVPDKP